MAKFSDFEWPADVRLAWKDLSLPDIRGKDKLSIVEQGVAYLTREEAKRLQPVLDALTLEKYGDTTKCKERLISLNLPKLSKAKDVPWLPDLMELPDDTLRRLEANMSVNLTLDSFKSFMSGAFVWNSSPEGFDFWNAVREGEARAFNAPLTADELSGDGTVF